MIFFKKLIKNIFFTVVVMLLLSLIIIGVPIIINELYIPNKGYLTVWGGEDVLAYYGSMIGALGTIVLGIIAWKQNQRLLSIEERNYLSENIGGALITEIKVTGTNKLSVNLDNEHVEQIIETNKYKMESTSISKAANMSLVCTLESMGNTTPLILVRVSKVCLCVKNIKTYVTAINTNKEYSKLALYPKDYKFEVLMLMTNKEKENLVNALKSSESSLLIEMELSVLTSKYVETHLICKVKLNNPKFDEKEKIYGYFKKLDNNQPVCFWNGVYLKNKQDIVIKMLKEDEGINVYGKNENGIP